MANAKSEQPTIGVIVLLAEGCSSTSVTATLEMLESANYLQRARGVVGVESESATAFKVSLVSIDGLPVTASGGVTLTPTASIENAPPAALVIVPGFLFRVLDLLPSLGGFIPWLRQRHADGNTIASLCTGAFLTAEAGLLDDRVATTHWYYADVFRQRYPRVNLQEHQTVTDDSGVLCSGGATASNDLLLHMLQKFAGKALAREFSRKLLIDSSRSDQSPYMVTTFNRRHEDDAILRVQDWLEGHYKEAIHVQALAEQFGFSLRHFIRRFKQATRQSPSQYLQNLRLEDAKLRLESSKMSFEQITYQVGYEDPNSFRRLFRDRVGVSPSDYRRKFQR